MEMTIEQAVGLLGELWQKRELDQLHATACEIAKQRPTISQSWRYRGIVDVLRGGGDKYLRQAALLDDGEAAIWLSVLNQFASHPRGSIGPHDVITQVGLEKMRRSRYMDYPTEVTIETQAICNAACNFCPYPTMERQGDKMSDALIEKIINDLTAIPQEVPFTISPFKVSDPFLDKRIFSVCEKINTTLPNAKLRLFTNGSPLTAGIIEKIANIRNVVHLWVSLNEYEAIAYENLMKLPFNKTILKLDMLHQRVAAGYPHPVTVSRVADGSERDKAFREFVRNRYPLFEVFMIGRGDWTGQVDVELQKAVPPTACSRWYELSIMASGKVALCCMDGEGKYIVGDVNTQSVLEIYNDPQYRKMRQYTFSRLAAAAPCDTCVY